jgi:DNA polymerase-4
LLTAPLILHVDLDAFYAQVEQRDRPELRGRPVIVGGHPTRGVVLAASYEVRPFGVRSALPMVQAMRLCPEAIVVRPRMSLYADVSRRFMEILSAYSPSVESLSLDEAFLDVSGEERLFGGGLAIARTIKHRTRAELGLAVSAGLASTKFVAKVATDRGKPDGLVVVPAGGEEAFLAPLPIGVLWGVGKVAEQKLRGLGVNRVGDLGRVDLELLAASLGHGMAQHLLGLSRGLDERTVEPDRRAVSVGHEDTFEADVRDRQALWPHLLEQADRTASRLRHQGFRARVVTLKVKYADHRIVTRRQTLESPTDDGTILARTARQLLERVPEVERRGVRLTGISCSGLVEDAAASPGSAPGSPAGQLSLRLGGEPASASNAAAATVPAPPAAATPPPERRLGPTLDEIAARFGHGALKRASLLGADDPSEGPGRKLRRDAAKK